MKEAKRVGVITQYYLSSNYGGLLQAYALVEYLKKHGYAAEQITYNFYETSKKVRLFEKSSNKSFVLRLKIIAKDRLLRLNNYIHGLGNLSTQRRDICKEFRDSIPHTTKIFENDTLYELNNYYDVFITGSDQVWNPDRYREGFFLTFVDSVKKSKISYAASISNRIPANMRSVYRDKLKDFDIITVREKNDVKALMEVIDKKVSWVLDPVFLLTQDEWSRQIKGIKTNISKPFIFCYFLGDSAEQRSLVSDFAKKNDLLIVTIPFMGMNYRKCDKNFGDIKLNNVSPNQFLYLIQNSKYVFTDSFHASAFSIIFKKTFIAFDRSGNSEMKERIVSLTKLFECEKQFCVNNNMVLDNIENILKNNVVYNYDKFVELMKSSEKILDFSEYDDK